MFDHYPFVLNQHRAALASAVRIHSVVSAATAPILAALYKHALDGLTAPVKADGYYTSTLNTSDEITVSSATDAKSGLWVQLARAGGRLPVLTIGQKWSMEQFNTMTGSTNTIIW